MQYRQVHIDMLLFLSYVGLGIITDKTGLWMMGYLIQIVIFDEGLVGNVISDEENGRGGLIYC